MCIRDSLIQSEMGKQYFDRIVFIIDVASSFFSFATIHLFLLLKIFHVKMLETEYENNLQFYDAYIYVEANA